MKATLDRLIITGFVLLTSILLLTKPSFADDSVEVPNLLPRDTPGLLQIKDVETTVQRLKQLPLFTDERWIKVQELLETGDSPFIPTDRLVKILETLDQAESLLPKIKEVALAVHDFDLERGTLFVQADSETLDQLQVHIGTIVACLFDHSIPIDKVSEINLKKVNRCLDYFFYAEVRRYDQFLIISNTGEYLNRLDWLERFAETGVAEDFTEDVPVKDEPEKETESKAENDESEHPTLQIPKKFKSLFDSRAYETIQKRSTRLGDSSGLVSIFLRPAHLQRFFSGYDEEDWKGYGYHELTGAGLNLVAMPTPANSGEPMLLADATVMFTEPKTGKALMMTHYEPVEIPKLTVKPIRLMTYARNETLYYKESLRCYDEMYGKDSAVNYFLGRYAQAKVDFYSEALPRRSGFLELEYLKTGTTTAMPKIEEKENEEDQDEKSTRTTIRTLPLQSLELLVKEWEGLDDDSEQTNNDSTKPQSSFEYIETADSASFILNNQIDLNLGNLTHMDRGNVRAMCFEKIKDRDAMLRYVKGMMRTDARFSPLTDPDFKIWCLDEEGIVNNIGYLQDDTSSPHADNMSHDCYLVGSEWYAEGEWPTVRDQMAHMENYSDDIEDYGIPIRNLVKNLLHHSQDEDPIQIQYFEPESWTHKIQAMQSPNSGSGWHFSPIEGSSGEFRIVAPTKRWGHMPKEKPKPKKESEKLTPDFIELTIDPFQQKTNEKIHQAKQLAAKIVVENFGRQLLLHTRTDTELRVLFGCYPMP